MSESDSVRLWSVGEWCAAAGVSRGWYYTTALPPRTVHLGRAVRILETPREYAERIERLEAAQAADAPA
jgi:hypothetical protein